MNAPSNKSFPELATLERAYKNHKDAQIKNIERLQTVHKHYNHAAAMCKAMVALLQGFEDRKVYMIVEPEISKLGKISRPEDFVAWVEGVGIFVIEIKSHTINGISSFENNVPQVMYQGRSSGDKDLLDQPREFAYDLKAPLEELFDRQDLELPPLYYAGWLPNVSPEDVASRSQHVDQDKVWLSDMLDVEVFKKRVPELKNITRSSNVSRDALELFCKVFGSTSGLRKANNHLRNLPTGSLGQLIDRKNNYLKRLTKEQEDLAFSPNLTRGPKVIRGVAGSGKTIVLANAVAEVFLREITNSSSDIGDKRSFDTDCIPEVLVLCYNRSLVPYLKELIINCFNIRKNQSQWPFPFSKLTIQNIDRYARKLAGKKYDFKDISKAVDYILDNGLDKDRYRYTFVDEGQDLILDWYPLLRHFTQDQPELGRSIIIFYDDAQNIYGRPRPGSTSKVPPWKELLGADVNPRGLKTIMRVGHRNTNKILSFSFSLLLGSLAEDDPQMIQFSGISEFKKERIPDDPSLDHPNAGKLSVEQIDNRQFKINFAVEEGMPPVINSFLNEELMLNALVKRIKYTLSADGDNVQPDDVLIMAPFTDQVVEISKRLQKEDIAVHIPVKLKNGHDGRDQSAFVPGKVTVSTINSAKGYTAHICHLTYVHSFEKDDMAKENIQRMRAQIHVACTRSSLLLELWGLNSPLMQEAQEVQALIS
ncbi:hypothetical protein AWQ21_14585 (plasmid) [Picosynechococcus sp. PCC 7003]|uniref:DNA/RNA helicase domain-containing protein n=1 Tax=Picosynechococcus sp. PCC 7003 TaxID=374981 RepID=UPI000810877D|nr:DNA/RNA helicase domain-containing protein [Picosynechococcus sp. PCC 7003]ANV85758.1 hypothetical protein AWQ21_14585 [Picosynechococcus sp. PCC 7003]